MKRYLRLNWFTLIVILVMVAALFNVPYTAFLMSVVWWIYVLLSPLLILFSVAFVFSAFDKESFNKLKDSGKITIDKMRYSLFGCLTTSVVITLSFIYGWVYVPIVLLIMVMSLVCLVYKLL